LPLLASVLLVFCRCVSCALPAGVFPVFYRCSAFFQCSAGVLLVCYSWQRWQQTANDKRQQTNDNDDLRQQTTTTTNDDYKR
jgi:hypothetical protein